jgi:DNA-binding TFAR19-related protein (PDSD5 family)
MPEPETEELRRAQLARERAEREAAAREDDEEAVREHDRRAQRAAYLREKLSARAESEDGAG